MRQSMFVYEQSAIDQRPEVRLSRPVDTSPVRLNLYAKVLNALGVKKRTEQKVITIVLILFLGGMAYLPAVELLAWYHKASAQKAQARQDFVRSLSPIDALHQRIDAAIESGAEFETFASLYTEYYTALNATQKAWGREEIPPSLDVLFAIKGKLGDLKNSVIDAAAYPVETKKDRASKALLDITVYVEAKELRELMASFNATKAIEDF